MLTVMIHPHNTQQRKTSILAISINEKQDIVTFYEHTPFSREDYSWYVCQQNHELTSSLRPLLTKLNLAIVNELDPIHSELHPDNEDQEDVFHIHLRFLDGMNYSALEQLFTELSNYQDNHQRQDSPALFPNNDVISDILNAIKEYLKNPQNDKRIELNCVPHVTNNRRNTVPYFGESIDLSGDMSRPECKSELESITKYRKTVTSTQASYKPKDDCKESALKTIYALAFSLNFCFIASCVLFFFKIIKQSKETTAQNPHTLLPQAQPGRNRNVDKTSKVEQKLR